MGTIEDRIISKNQAAIEIPVDLLDAIRSFPVRREVEHCGAQWTVEPFDIYAHCPRCGARIKLRSLSAAPEIEDIFDAVLEWMNQPTAADVANRRRMDLEAD